MLKRIIPLVSLAALLAVLPLATNAANLRVTRATLSNGLQIIVVHDPLAPVVTTMLNYKVGSDDQTIDGLAHATEHMMFRGSKTLSSSGLMDSIDITGGAFDADTANEVTQYFFTIPSQYLDIALRAERSRATGLLMSQSLWNQERGAITQEVTRDNSDATYRLAKHMQQNLIGGTPYAKNGLGTVKSFADQVNSPQLLNFYHTWYHPNNAVYVIVGDIDGPATIAKVRSIFGDIPAAKLPARDPVRFQAVKPGVFRETSDKAFTAVLLGYRLPGYGSKDYAAGQVLADVLNSQRGELVALAAAGKVYQTQVQVQSFPKISIAMVEASVPIATNPDDAAGWMRDVIHNYASNGIPADLVAAAKLSEISQLEFNANGIENLAFEWSQALAVQGLQSPDDAISAFKGVTVADVNRVLHRYLDTDTVVAGYAVPNNTGATASGGGGGQAKENNSIPPSTHEPLPSWATAVLTHLSVPKQTLTPASMTLSNGIHLIVQPETVTNTVSVVGYILNNSGLQEPAGKDGVADVVSSLLPYGTMHYDRIGFQAQLDKIAASTQAGTQFSLDVLSSHFDRGVELLADEQLHPAFSAKDFAIVRRQAAQGVAGAANSPDHLAQVALVNALYPEGDSQRRFATVQTVESLTLDDVKAWYASAYRPDLATIVVIGNVKPAQARATFEKYFGAWSASGPKPNVYPPPVANNAPGSATIPATGRVQSTVELVESIGLLRSNPDWANLQLGNTVLTGGFYSSLLYHDLRELHGYVYDVSSRVQAGKTRSAFLVKFGSDPKNITSAENEIVANLHNVQQHPIAMDRLLKSKALLLGAVPISEASYSGVAKLLLNYAASGLPLNQNLIDARRELNATPDAVREAFNRWIRPNDFIRVITGPGPDVAVK